MKNLKMLEDYYNKFINELDSLPKESINFVDLDLLFHLDLLHFHPKMRNKKYSFSPNFQMIDSKEKVTMFNREFIVWITPQGSRTYSSTCVMIALNRNDQEPQIEMVFYATGIYNSSSLVLKILEKFLIEIEENERMISQLKLEDPNN